MGQQNMIERMRTGILGLDSMIEDGLPVSSLILVAGDCLPGEPYPVEIAQIAEGVRLLHNTEEDFVRRRSIEILKMCRTAHHLGRYAVDISSRGIMVYPGL